MADTRWSLHNPIGLTLCDCGNAPPHADVVFAGLQCGLGDPEGTYALMRDCLATGRNVELVGDLVQMLDDEVPLVSGFVYYGGAPRQMSVPDRASLEVNEHCRVCPHEIPPVDVLRLIAAEQKRLRRSAKRSRP